jgi:hypothetical protein
MRTLQTSNKSHKHDQVLCTDCKLVTEVICYCDEGINATTIYIQKATIHYVGMKSTKFKTVSDFSARVLDAAVNNCGCVCKRKIGYITKEHANSFESVLCHTAMALQEKLNVSVYSKENMCAGSKTVIIAVYWSSLWIYLLFYRKNADIINVFVLYRKKKMDGMHSAFDQGSPPLLP